jgi:hypothetical protein
MMLNPIRKRIKNIGIIEVFENYNIISYLEEFKERMETLRRQLSVSFRITGSHSHYEEFS